MSGLQRAKQQSGLVENNRLHRQQAPVTQWFHYRTLKLGAFFGLCPLHSLMAQTSLVPTPVPGAAPVRVHIFSPSSTSNAQLYSSSHLRPTSIVHKKDDDGGECLEECGASRRRVVRLFLFTAPGDYGGITVRRGGAGNRRSTKTN